MINSTSSKLKSYLIDKLLNESTNNNNNNIIKNDSSIISQNALKQFKPTKMEFFETNNNDLKCKSLIRNESKEDLVSETGTYTIDDNPDDNVQNKEQIDIPVKQSIDLISARAAIDEKFGIIKRPMIDESPDGSTITDSSFTEPLVSKSVPHKRTTQKMIRERNRTYSLSKDVLPDGKYEDEEVTLYKEDKNENNNNNNNNGLENSDTNEISIKKTMTYDVIPNYLNKIDEHDDLNRSIDANSKTFGDSSSLNTSMTIGTNVLIGDTEKLIEELKKRRIEKKQQLKERLQAANNSKTAMSSSSSSCSSSLSHPEHDLAHSEVKSLKSWTIPNESTSYPNEEETAVSSRATVGANSQIGTSTSHKIGNGGMAFDFMLVDNNTPTNKEPGMS